jgi:UDP-N-acetylmuramyl pentapeptide synthase
MLDLGESAEAAHAALVAKILAAKPTVVILIGPLMRSIGERLSGGDASVRGFDDVAAAVAEFSTLLPAPGVVLVKGSRGNRLEELLQILKTQAPTRAIC